MRKVLLTAKAFVNAIKFLAQFANFNMPRAQWVEAMGFLFCKTHMNNYIIADAVGMTSGNEVYVQMDNYQLAQVVELENERPGTFLGGWFHSHPGLSIFYSDTDCRNQMFYQQQNPDGLGFVFDLTTVSPTFIGLKVFRLVSANSTQYQEVPYELKGFTEETLVEAFDAVGVPRKVVHELAEYLGFGNPDGYVEMGALEVPETDDPAGTGREYLEKAGEARRRGALEKALEYCRIAEVLLEGADAPDAHAESLVRLADLCVHTRNFQTAEESVAKLEKIPLKGGKACLLGEGLLVLGKMKLLEEEDGEVEKGLEYLSRAREAFREAGFPAGEAEALEYSGSVHWRLGERHEAKSDWEAALELVAKLEEEGAEHPLGRPVKTIWALKRFGLENRVARVEAGLEEGGVTRV
ncbi:MAG: hypothetical protein ACTSU5_22020 [Promethearchaeota archaeon]